MAHILRSLRRSTHRAVAASTSVADRAAHCVVNHQHRTLATLAASGIQQSPRQQHLKCHLLPSQLLRTVDTSCRRFHYEPAPFEPTSQWSFPEAAAIVDLYSNWRPIEDDDGFRLVFLEGGAGVGKSTVTKRLESMGFAVYHENYVNMCTRGPYSPRSSAMSLRWMATALQAIENAQQSYINDPTSLRNGVLFVDRSFLSPALYSKGLPVEQFAYDVMNDIQEAYDCTSVYCKADRHAKNLRLEHRTFEARTHEREVRAALGETDPEKQLEFDTRYDRLDASGCFAASLDTSIPKLATTALLDALGLGGWNPKGDLGVSRARLS